MLLCVHVFHLIIVPSHVAPLWGARPQAFCCADIVSLEGEATLAEQLMAQHGGGFELHTWSNLPTGSGMGTSR